MPNLSKTMHIKTFQFNFIEVNTYVLYDETKEAVIIDPGMMTEKEENILDAFIRQYQLTVKCVAITHAHVDHVLGCGFCARKYNVPIWMHEAGLPIYESAVSYGVVCNLPCEKDNFPVINHFYKAGDILRFGNGQGLKVLYTPGHADGSVCLYSEAERCVFVGDVLFEGSIGRSDFPTGNIRTLLESIRTQLLTLPDDTVVYPGHGPATTIGQERATNPYVKRIPQ